MKGGDEMINQYVIEGKCIMQPFTDIDGRNRLYAQINLLNNDVILCVRTYNSKMINSIINDVKIDMCIMITGHVSSTIEQGGLIMTLIITKYTVV